MVSTPKLVFLCACCLGTVLCAEDSHAGHDHGGHDEPPCTAKVAWKAGYNESAIEVRTGGKVTFEWTGHLNVAAAKDKVSFDACNSTGSTLLSLEEDDEHAGHDHRVLAGHDKKGSYVWNVGTTAGTYYLLSSEGSVCSKIAIIVEADDEKCAGFSGSNKLGIHTVASLSVLLSAISLIVNQQ